ncbi:MAG: serine/threonine-protein kinase [Gemmataceae bacterium]
MVRKSSQVDTDRLDGYLRERGRESLPAHPRQFALQLIRDGYLTRFQAEQFLLGKHKGFTLGGYRVLERLGAGGVGAVYLAEHQVMRRRVAIKVLPPCSAEAPGTLERFYLEARAAAALDHPNVIHIFDFRHEGALHFLVMEYIDGPNLQQMVARRGPLPIPMACDYIRQAAQGLQHAHERGMIHRDVKPANLLVDSTGTVKILDLGLARFDIADEHSVTRKFNSKIVLGTADYLAPEQALDLHTVDHRADLYSLGATLYTLLAGRPPFHDGSIGQKLMWHQSKEPAPITDLRPETPPELAALVARLLAKKPAERVQTAGAVADALAAWAEPSPPGMDGSVHVLSELPFGPRTSRLDRTSMSGRLPALQPAADTQVTRARDDTTSMHAERRNTVPDVAMAPPGATSWHWLVLSGVVGVIAGLVGGVVAFLLWGPRAG